MVQQLERRGFIPIDAHWVLAPSNYPPHIAPVEKLKGLPLLGTMYHWSGGLGRILWEKWHLARILSTLVWLEASYPMKGDREALEEFLDRVVGAVLAAKAGGRWWPPRLAAKTFLPTVKAGEALPLDKAIMQTRDHLSIDRDRCNRCGLCFQVCPVGCITEDPEGFPHLGQNCTGCYACFNHCAQEAMSAWLTPHGIGRYPGPPREMRQLFNG
jgi:NAD-dependent dihydropyrimidine dehydrogenase PreA subunit